MKENIEIVLLNLAFLIISFLYHYFSLKMKMGWVAIISIGYIVIVYFLFAGAVYLHEYLRDRGIFFQFGHADEILVEFLLLWEILSVANIIAVAIRKNYKGKV